jgi:hypothetical protein
MISLLWFVASWLAAPYRRATLTQLPRTCARHGATSSTDQHAQSNRCARASYQAGHAAIVASLKEVDVEPHCRSPAAPTNWNLGRLEFVQGSESMVRCLEIGGGGSDSSCHVTA